MVVVAIIMGSIMISRYYDVLLYNPYPMFGLPQVPWRRITRDTSLLILLGYTLEGCLRHENILAETRSTELSDRKRPTLSNENTLCTEMFSVEFSETIAISLLRNCDL